MTGIVPETYGSIGPWQRYIAKEHAARDAYLATVQGAHREYLTGPWPDRDAYTHVERSAWMTYYAAGRDAWRHYTREIQPPPPPPAIVVPGPLAQARANDRAEKTGGPAPYPTFTEHDRSDEPWPSN